MTVPQIVLLFTLFAEEKLDSGYTPGNSYSAEKMTQRKTVATSNSEKCTCSCGCKRMGAKMKTAEGKTYRLLLCGLCMQTHQKSPRMPF
jgi:hypothetical protein